MPSLCHPGHPRTVRLLLCRVILGGAGEAGGRENAPPGSRLALTHEGFPCVWPALPRPPRKGSQITEVPWPSRRRPPPPASFLPEPGPPPRRPRSQSRQVPPHPDLVFPVAQLGPGSDARRKEDTLRETEFFWLPQRDRGLWKPLGRVPRVTMQPRCCHTKSGVPGPLDPHCLGSHSGACLTEPRTLRARS